MENVINKVYSLMLKGTSRKNLRILAFLAFSWSLYQGWRFVNFIEGNLVRKSRNLRVRYGEGTYALIIDPLTAVGNWFCIELARRSFNLILLGTDQTKLQNVIEKCKKINPNIEAKLLIFDIQKANDETYYDLLFSHIKHLNISLLVANNTSHHKGGFLKMTSRDIYNIMLKDCYSTLFLYRKVIPSMLGRTSPSGVIIISGYKPWSSSKYPSFLSGTRAFRYFLSRSIGIEYSNKLDVLVVNPFEIVGETKEDMVSNLKDNTEANLGYSTLSLDNNLTSLDISMRERIRKNSREEKEQPPNLTSISEVLDHDTKQEVSSEAKEEVLVNNIPFWRRVSAKDFVVSCLEKLSFEKETYGHWKHEIVGFFTRR